MTKIIVKSLLMVGIVLGLSNYALYIMTGKSPFSGFKAPNLSLSPPSTADIKRGLGVQEVTYKWKDERGVVHYSSEPPPAGIEAEQVSVDPNTNLVQGLAPAEAPEETPTSPLQAPTLQSPLGAYDPESVKKLVDDARNLQQLMNERDAHLRGVVGER